MYLCLQKCSVKCGTLKTWEWPGDEASKAGHIFYVIISTGQKIKIQAGGKISETFLLAEISGYTVQEESDCLPQWQLLSISRQPVLVFSPWMGT
jgi:hypothetical protein